MHKKLLKYNPLNCQNTEVRNIFGWPPALSSPVEKS